MKNFNFKRDERNAVSSRTLLRELRGYSQTRIFCYLVLNDELLHSVEDGPRRMAQPSTELAEAHAVQEDR